MVVVTASGGSSLVHGGGDVVVIMGTVIQGESPSKPSYGHHHTQASSGGDLEVRDPE